MTPHHHVSVIVPIHNNERTLKRALDSVLNQTWIARDPGNHLEVVCILNCCTDNSRQVIEKLDDQLSETEDLQREIVVHSCETKGIVPALNVGLEVATNSLIARQDADDFWHTTKLEKQIEFLDNNPDIDIVGTQIQLVTPDTYQHLSVSQNPTDHDSIKKALFLGYNPIAHPSVVFKRDILLKTGTYSSLFPVAEDLDLWARAMLCEYKFANVDEPLVDYTSTVNPNYRPGVPQLIAYLANILTATPEKYGTGAVRPV